jgi:hypothetical protein
MHTRGRRLVVLALTVLLTAALTWIVTAQTSPPAIHACADRFGQLRVIRASRQCLSTELRLQWNVSGPQGPPGTAGPPGPPGAGVIAYDSVGRLIGPLIHLNVTTQNGVVNAKIGERNVLLEITPTAFGSTGVYQFLHYQGPGCTGTPILQGGPTAGMSPPALVFRTGGHLFVAEDPDAPRMDVPVASRLFETGCAENVTTVNGWRAAYLGRLTYYFTPPYSIK